MTIDTLWYRAQLEAKLDAVFPEKPENEIVYGPFFTEWFIPELGINRLNFDIDSTVDSISHDDGNTGWYYQPVQDRLTVWESTSNCEILARVTFSGDIDSRSKHDNPVLWVSISSSNSQCELLRQIMCGLSQKFYRTIKDGLNAEENAEWVKFKKTHNLQ